MESLWKNLDTLTSDIKNPLDLIKEQSGYLSEGTEGIFYISNAKLVNPSGTTKKVLVEKGVKDRFAYRAGLCSEYMQEYSYNIFNLYYDITFYPLIMNIPNTISEEIQSRISSEYITSGAERSYYMIRSQDAFEEILSEIFNCESLRTVMKNMRTIIGSIEQEE